MLATAPNGSIPVLSLIGVESNRIRKQLPYKMPPGYKPWKDIASDLGMALASLSMDSSLLTIGDYTNASLQGLWVATRAPMYVIKRDLLRAFDLSDVAEDKGLLVDLNPPLPTFMLVLPQNTLVTPDGTTINNLTVHLADKAYPQRSVAPGSDVSFVVNLPYPQNLLWVALDSSGVIWHDVSGVAEDGTLKNDFSQTTGNLNLSKADHDFVKRVERIVCQVLLALTYRPDLLGAEALPKQAQAKGFGGAGKAETSTLYPRWLGSTFKLASDTPTQATPGKAKLHSSPVAHWRRGHWRRVPVGSREFNERKWVFIQPTFVNG
jgi:hypothetical protein